MTREDQLGQDCRVESVRQNGRQVGVKVVHLPTGIVCLVEDEPSFMKARAKAFGALQQRLDELEGKPG